MQQRSIWGELWHGEDLLDVLDDSSGRKKSSQLGKGRSLKPRLVELSPFRRQEDHEHRWSLSIDLSF